MSDVAARAHKRSIWPNLLASFAAIWVIAVIALGAHVTTSRTGDSDPTWNPLMFWRWFRPAEGGLKYELTHRQFATYLGVLITILMAVVLKTEWRKSVRRLGIFLFVFVCLQGLFGGLRVKVISDENLADFFTGLFGTGVDVDPIRIGVVMVHAVFAQTLFALLVTMAIVTSKGWMLGNRPVQRSAFTDGTRRLAWVTLLALMLQLVLGAYVRHSYAFHEGQISTPVVLVHLGVGIGAAWFVYLLRKRSALRHKGHRWIVRPPSFAWYLILFQLVLGGVAWYFRVYGKFDDSPFDYSMLLRSLHVINGAAILGLVVLTICRSYKLLARESEAQVAESEQGSAGNAAELSPESNSLDDQGIPGR